MLLNPANSTGLHQLLQMVVLRLANAQYCPAGFDDLLDGTPCENAEVCLRLSNSEDFNCVNGYCCRNSRSLISNFCGVNEVSIAGVCYPLSSEGHECTYSTQCQPNHLICRDGICSDSTVGEPDCLNPEHEAEKMNGYVKSCLEERCSPGYKCEYHPLYLGGDYICCGKRSDEYNYDYGVVRVYPGTKLPLECFSATACKWADTPNCIFSERHGHNVCCSTYNC
ncbi:unnamed protein product, partial [Mesorhabditis spiculigera]